jgi:hypothetical protein
MMFRSCYSIVMSNAEVLSQRSIRTHPSTGIDRPRAPGVGSVTEYHVHMTAFGSGFSSGHRAAMTTNKSTIVGSRAHY